MWHDIFSNSTRQAFNVEWVHSILTIKFISIYELESLYSPKYGNFLQMKHPFIYILICAKSTVTVQYFMWCSIIVETYDSK